jgi:hypothetical protein
MEVSSYHLCLMVGRIFIPEFLGRFQRRPLTAVRLDEPAVLRAGQQPLDPALRGHRFVRQAQPIFPVPQSLDIATLARLQRVSRAEFLRDFDHAFCGKDRRHGQTLRLSHRIVNFGLRDREAGGRDERQAPLRLGAGVQSFREMLEQLFLLRQGQRIHSKFDFSKCAHGGKYGTGPRSQASLRHHPLHHLPHPRHRRGAGGVWLAAFPANAGEGQLLHGALGSGGEREREAVHVLVAARIQVRAAGVVEHEFGRGALAGVQLYVRLVAEHAVTAPAHRGHRPAPPLGRAQARDRGAP